MHVLVTGGAGYIGSVICRKLLKAGHSVSVLDDLSTSDLSQLSPSVTFIKASVLDPELTQFLHDVDAVIHCAAKSLVSESVQKPDLYHRNNVEGSVNLIAAMKAAGVAKMVFSSSAAVYAGSPDPITEETREEPGNPYGKTKLLVDQALQNSGFTGASLRYFNVAGALQDGEQWIGERHDPETHLIPNLLAATEEKPFTLFGDDWPTPDGTCIRDYIHVEDLAEAHLDALALTNYEILNLGSNRGSSVKEVMATAEQVLGRSIVHTIAPRRPGDPAVLVASYAKAKKVLGWEPKRTLEEMISSAAAATAQPW